MTARKSTGGMAPRKQLSTKAARKECPGKAPKVQLATRVPRGPADPKTDSIPDKVPISGLVSIPEVKTTTKPVSKAKKVPAKKVPATKPRVETMPSDTVPVRKSSRLIAKKASEF